MGASVDHDSQTMYVNSNEISWITKLVKKNNKTISTFKRMKDQDGYPGNKPPWGKITSLNLNNGKINWSIPFGTYKELESKNNNKATLVHKEGCDDLPLMKKSELAHKILDRTIEYID